MRPATLEDADLLVGWHLDPDVRPFWDGHTFTRDEMVQRLMRADVDAYIVEAVGEAVGYMQAWFGETSDVGGLDMFLIPSARGRALGPDAGRTLACYLLTDGGRERVTVDPYVWNERAVAGWRKAGFRPVGEREPDHEHVHRWLLMEFDASEVTRHVAAAEMAAREMGGLSLADALSLCELLANADPARYERAALRWLQRFIDGAGYYRSPRWRLLLRARRTSAWQPERRRRDAETLAPPWLVRTSLPS